MESYWPTVLDNPKSKPPTLKHARWLQNALQVVVSRTMKSELDHRVNLRLVKNTTLGEKIVALHYERTPK